MARIDGAQGALVANYPWDANETGDEGYGASPDDSAFRFLARTYATSHRNMVHAPEFAAKGGITNGAEWYQISGSMQVQAHNLLFVLKICRFTHQTLIVVLLFLFSRFQNAYH